MIKVLIAAVSDFKKTETLSSMKKQLLFWPEEAPQNHNMDFVSAIGHFLCEHLLSEQNVSQETINTLHKNEFGKWRLVSDSIDFNISHSGDKVLAAITNQGVIGVDIEKVRPIAWRDFKESFSFDEWEFLSASPDSEMTFFDLWTRKESLAKAYGLGLQLPLDSLHVLKDIGKVDHTSMSGYFYPLQMTDYKGYVCMSNHQDVVVQNFSRRS